jgi:catechol 2,3-dioxygenase-like lactoylglutathione lyase family enzyme
MNKRRVLLAAAMLALGAASGWILSGCHSAAAAAATADLPPPIHHIRLDVSNMRDSLVFYQDMLGFRPESLGDDFSMLKGANVDVYLSTSGQARKPLREGGERPGQGMYPHFVVPNVQAITARLKNAGCEIVQEPRQYNWGTEAFVADPDGYTWALINWAKKP